MLDKDKPYLQTLQNKYVFKLIFYLLLYVINMKLILGSRNIFILNEIPA